MKPFPSWGALAAFMLTVAARAAENPPPVQVSEDATQIVLDNGSVGLTVSKQSGVVSSIRGRVNGQDRELGNGSNAMYFDFDNHNRGHWVFGQQGSATTRLLNSSPDSAEVSVASEPGAVCPFRTDIHYILRRGDSGFYCYVVYQHGAGMPACTWEQTRAVIRTVKGTDPFSNYVIDDARTGPYPSGQVLRTVFDTTWLYAADNTAHSKYEFASFIGDDLVHGLAGHGVGLWMIAPSRE